MDYYKILGVDRNATQEEIKKAYRRMAHKYHPDKGGGDEAKFKEVNEAHQILSNRQKRAEFDQFDPSFAQGSPGQGHGFNARGFGFGSGAAPGGEPASGWEDIFEQFFAGSGHVRTRAKTQARGRDMQISIDIKLEEAYSGVTRDISFDTYIICEKCAGKKHEAGSSMKTCETCGGRGQINSSRRTILGSFATVSVCSKCHGEGRVPQIKCAKCAGEGRVRGRRDVKIEIPAGVKSGDVVKIAGGGEAQAVSVGDLFVHINVIPNKEFKLNGNDLYNEIEILYSMAALGGTVKVNTIKGQVSLKIPKGIHAGELIRLRGKGLPVRVRTQTGMPQVNTSGFGDQYVKIKIKTPRALSKKAKELLEKLKEEGL